MKSGFKLNKPPGFQGQMLELVKLEVCLVKGALSGRPTRKGSPQSKHGRREMPIFWKEQAIFGLLGWASLFGLTCDINVEG